MNQTKSRVRATMNQVWTKASQKRAQTTRILTNISGGDSSYSSINGNSARILSTSAAVVTAASMIENETLCEDSSFPEEILQYDTYNGVTVYLEKLSDWLNIPP